MTAARPLAAILAAEVAGCSHRKSANEAGTARAVRGHASPRFCNVRVYVCAVTRRRFPVGASPTRPDRSSRKQPEQSWR